MNAVLERPVSTPPHDLAAERAVLGAILLDPTTLAATASLEPDDFHKDAHRIIFATMRRLEAEGRGIDAITVAAALQQAGLFDVTGGQTTLALLQDEGHVASLVPEYVQIIRERARQRGALRLSGELAEAALIGGPVLDARLGDVQRVPVLDRSHSSTPRADFWPTLAHEALYGLAGDIVHAVEPYTEADPVATLTHVLVGLGNVAGRGPHAAVGYDQHPGRIFAVLTGATGKGRKGTAESTPRHLLRQVDELWERTRVKTGLSSGEGLIYAVRDPLRVKQPLREGGRVVDYQEVIVDDGEPDKRLLVLEPEFAVTLKVIGRDTNTLSGQLRQAWDTGDLATLTRNSPLRASGAHVSIVANVTEEEVRRYLTETERANGFANRFLWLLVRRSKVLPEPTAIPGDELEPLAQALRAVVGFARTVGPMVRDADARAMWAEVYPVLSEGHPGLVGAILNRAEAQVLRLSVLYALLDCSPMIRPAHLKAALAVWEYAEASARRIFGDRLGAPIADVILDALRRRGPLRETDIHGLFARHKKAEEIQRALDTLLAAGLVRRRQHLTDGRSATIWEAV